MKTMLLLLAAPLQSWGVRSASERKRDTARHPSRSGVIGLLAACQGLDRTQPLDWAGDLTIHVRVDRPGQTLTDYHTVGGGYRGQRRMRTASNNPRDDALVTRRDYLADAAFVVAVTGPDDLVDRLALAVRSPRYTPFLGRKSCPPALPMLVGVVPGPASEALATVPAYQPPAATQQQAPATDPAGQDVTFDDLADAADPTGRDATLVTCLVHTENPAYTVATINDDPISFNHWARSYRSRSVGQETVRVPAAGTGLAALVAMRNAINPAQE
jgi:CRISPR system Cascade subunit CasD